MKNALTFYQQDTVAEKLPGDKDSGELTSPSCSVLFERKRKAKLVGLGRQKARARKAENVLLNRGRAKELDQEVETLEQNDNMPGRQGEVHLEKKIVLRG